MASTEDLLDELQRALIAGRKARREIAGAQREAGLAVKSLLNRGMNYRRIAEHTAYMLGLGNSPDVLRREGDRLRQLAHRVTQRHANEVARVDPATLAGEQASSNSAEANMTRVVKKTVTTITEYLDSDDLERDEEERDEDIDDDERDSEDDDAENDDEEEGEDAPRSRKRSGRYS
jgi:hypothetical protein